MSGPVRLPTPRGRGRAVGRARVSIVARSAVTSSTTTVQSEESSSGHSGASAAPMPTSSKAPSGSHRPGVPGTRTETGPQRVAAPAMERIAKASSAARSCQWRLTTTTPASVHGGGSRSEATTRWRCRTSARSRAISSPKAPVTSAVTASCVVSRSTSRSQWAATASVALARARSRRRSDRPDTRPAQTRTVLRTDLAFRPPGQPLPAQGLHRRVVSDVSERRRRIGRLAQHAGRPSGDRRLRVVRVECHDSRRPLLRAAPVRTKGPRG